MARLLLELLLAGFHTDHALLARLLRRCLPPSTLNDDDSHQGRAGRGGEGKGDVAMLVTLVKYGGEPLLGAVPRRVKVRDGGWMCSMSVCLCASECVGNLMRRAGVCACVRACF